MNHNSTTRNKYYLAARTSEPPCIFKHVLWALNAQVSLDSTLHTNKRNIIYCTLLTSTNK